MEKGEGMRDEGMRGRGTERGEKEGWMEGEREGGRMGGLAYG